MTNIVSSNLNRKQRRSLRITGMLTLITIVFVLSFLPYLTISILNGIYEDFWTHMTSSEILLYNFLLRTYIDFAFSRKLERKLTRLLVLLLSVRLRRKLDRLMSICIVALSLKLFLSFGERKATLEYSSNVFACFINAGCR
jgi:hypothetical protein